MSSVVWRKKRKKLATVIVGLFSLKEKAPTKNRTKGIYLVVKLEVSPRFENHIFEMIRLRGSCQVGYYDIT